MNQSYKTIFSKVHQCFVVVSELTKSHGKGSTSVNCGAKAKGRRVALAFAIALSVTGGAVFMPQVASAADIVIITSGSVIINDDTHKADVYYLNGSNITFTVNANGAVNSIIGNTDAAVSGNTVTINGGTVNNAGTDWTEYPAGSGNLVGKPNLAGGFSTSGAVTGNQVSITDATLGGDYPTVYGGHSLAGNVSKNSVTVESVNSDLYVYGGSSETGVAGGDTAADGNIVTVKSGEVYYVAGGSSTSGDVKNNKAVIEGGTVHTTVLGGYSTAGDATGNTVSISGGTVHGTVYGGYSAFSGGATGNTVSISGGTVHGTVYGGFSASSSRATGNTVILSKQEGKAAPELNGTVYGGKSPGDTVTGNTLQLEAAGLSAQEIKNFETVRLAGTLAWNDGATVLKAGKFADNETTDAGKKRASLDITDAETNLAKATLGQMTLLASDTADDFKTLSLVYSGGTEALSETNLSKVVKTGEETPEAVPVNGVTVSSISTHTVSLDAENSYKNVLYAVENTPTKITLGEMAWGKGRNLEGAYTFDNMVPIDATDLTFTGVATTALKKGESAALVTNATGITTENEVAQPTTDAGKTVTVDYTDAAGIKFNATASGHVAAAADAVNYVVDGVAVNSVNLADWNGKTSSVPDGWTAGANGVTQETEGSVTPETEDPVGGSLMVETDGMTVPELEAGKHKDILQADAAGFFTGAAINGANAYKMEAFTESDQAKSVTLAGFQGKGVTLNEEKNHLIYAAGTKYVDTVTLDAVNWKKDAELFDGSNAGYSYDDVNALGTDKFNVSYASPEEVSAGDSMTLLKANKTLTSEIADVKKANSYSYQPVTGVTVDANITGKLTAKGGAVTYTIAKNQASKLTFGNVDWKDSGALMTRPANITFSGADVDTSNIHFKNIESLQANKKMTLVSDFGDSVGTITGSKYMVGTAYEGEGAAKLDGSDLIFLTHTEAGGDGPHLAEQTHGTVMTMEAGLAMLAAGNDFIMKAQEGLQNTSVYASLGGATSRYKTGSHVNANTWNAIVAVGSKKDFEAGTLNLGVFAEYGEGNYKLHGSNVGGHGDAHYAGGGLLAKWTDPSNWYTEAGIRLGRLSNDANGILHDGAGRQYGYDKHSTYYGAHIGIGKVIEVDKGRSLDVYGKYFYTNYDGMNFHAGDDRYKLDDVTSSVVRTGLRFASTDKTWNWYGGLAYEYEFDGEARGKVNGDSVKSADIQGSSLRGEFGLKMDSTDTCPWKADIGVYGYTGKHRGVGGSVTIGYSF